MKSFLINTAGFGVSLWLTLFVLVGGVGMSLLSAFGHLV